MSSRIQKSAKNAKYGLLSQLLYLVLMFAVRYVMIRYLGLTSVSLNGLFTQVLGMLSLAEMGVGLAASYHLYGPLAKGDKKKVSAVMNLLRKAYYKIAAFIAVSGLALTPWIQYLVKDVDVPLPYLRVVYLMFLLTTSVSYLGSYKALLLSADQKAYLSSKISLAVRTVCSLLEIALIIVMRNFMLYLICESMYQVVYNLAVSKAVTKRYPYLDKKTELSKTEKQGVFHDIRQIFAGRISNKVLNSTDNILLSIIVNTVSVGVYSQYSMFANGFLRLFSALNEAIVGSVGNILVSEDKKKVSDSLRHADYLFYVMALFCGGCFYAAANPVFHTIFGRKYIIEQPVLYLVIFNMIFEIIKMPLWTYFIAAGMFAQDQYISFSGCILNIISSVILGKRLGMAGIFLGTLLSLALMYFWKLYLFSKKYEITISKKTAYLISAAGILFLCGKIEFRTGHELVNAVLQAGVAGILSIAGGILPFIKTDEFQYLKHLLCDFVKKRVGAAKKRTDVPLSD